MEEEKERRFLSECYITSRGFKMATETRSFFLAFFLSLSQLSFLVSNILSFFSFFPFLLISERNVTSRFFSPCAENESN